MPYFIEFLPTRRIVEKKGRRSAQFVNLIEKDG